MALTQVKTSGIADDAVDITKLKAGTDGELITYDTSGDPAKVAVGTSGHVLTSNGTGAAPTFQAASGGISDIVSDTTPQLGGDLDVNGNSIISSTTNQSITIDPNGTGSINLQTAVGGQTNLTSGGDVQFGSGVTNAVVRWDYSQYQLEFWDGVKASFGSSEDLEIWHDNTDNQIKGNNGKIVVSTTANNSDIEITPHGTGDVVIDGLKYPQADGSANQVLKTNGSAQLSWTTPSGGIASLVADTSPQLGGDLDTNSFEISLDDSHKVKFGASDDLTIEHNDTDALLKNDKGEFKILSDTFRVRSNDNSETLIRAIKDGEVELFHNDVLACETSANGLAFPSGKGIDFSATSDGSGTDTSELLDDYEEGTWVPTAGGSDNDSTYNVSGTGTYTKVGRLITVSAVFNNVSLSTSAGGIIYFKGLPYVPGFDSDLGAAFKFYGVGTDVDRPIIVLYSSTGGHLGMNKSGDNNATQYVSVDEFKGTGKSFDFSMVYQTS